MKNADEKHVLDAKEDELDAVKAERREKRKATRKRRKESAVALEALAKGKDLSPDDGAYYEGNPMYWLPDAEVDEKADHTDFVGEVDLKAYLED